MLKQESNSTFQNLFSYSISFWGFIFQILVLIFTDVCGKSLRRRKWRRTQRYTKCHNTYRDRYRHLSKISQYVSWNKFCIVTLLLFGDEKIPESQFSVPWSRLRWLKLTYHNELERKDTTDTDRSASFLDLNLEIDSAGRLRAKLYDKRDDFNFPIVNFPFICSNICIWSIYLSVYTIS